MQICTQKVQDHGADKEEGTRSIKKIESHTRTEEANLPKRGQSSGCGHVQVSGGHAGPGAAMEGALSICNAEGCEVGDAVSEAHQGDERSIC